jgi:predicted site-specific integrase-resolvase
MTRANRKSEEQVPMYVRSRGSGSRESIKRQEDAFLTYAKSIGADKISSFVHGTPVAVIHERPGLTKLLNDCKRDEFDTVVVKDLDRLSRASGEAAAIVESLEKSGVKLREASSKRLVSAKDLRSNGLSVSVKARRQGKGQAFRKRSLKEE